MNVKLTILQLYFRAQLILLALIAFFVFDQYKKQEPITRVAVDSIMMSIKGRIGLCNEACVQAWQEKNQALPMQALQKLMKIGTQYPAILKWALSKTNPDQQRQIKMIINLSSTTPEGVAIFKKTFGTEPQELLKLMPAY